VGIYLKAGEYSRAEAILDDSGLPHTERTLLLAGIKDAAGAIDEALYLIRQHNDKAKAPSVEVPETDGDYDDSTMGEDEGSLGDDEEAPQIAATVSYSEWPQLCLSLIIYACDVGNIFRTGCGCSGADQTPLHRRRRISGAGKLSMPDAGYVLSCPPPSPPVLFSSFLLYI